MSKKWLLSLSTFVFSLSIFYHAQAAGMGSWELAEDGKRWKYYYSVNDYAKDEWIEEDGKEYYIDSSGYMKTGWVKNSEDGNKYFMGEDGAKCFHMITPDHIYVNDKGIAIQSYETYRKAVKKELTSILKSKDYKNSSEQEAGFLFEDFNGDGIKDVAVVDRRINPNHLLYIAVWNSEEEKLNSLAEFDFGDLTRNSWLYYDWKAEKTWLEIYDVNGRGRDYFELASGDMQFKHSWHFEVKEDEWGLSDYIINGDSVDETEWFEQLSLVEGIEKGEAYKQFTPLTEEFVLQTVDQPPEDEGLWS
ncbi:hypothetical protein [Hungatella hathewayi]|uniref:hypothetical protein n=1 Tax=Hungatella hathewayi TaxID=154046 RepID=UPI00356A7F48